MIGRILRPADFQLVLAAPQRSRSAHFAVHYVAGVPSRPKAAANEAATAALVPLLSPELSTGGAELSTVAVDDGRRWLGLVVPKRHAKRAVTRNLIKRQLRAAMACHAGALPAGLWVVRLRAPFDRKQFLSPASEVLRAVAHDEIAQLFQRAARPAPAGPAARPRARP